MREGDFVRVDGARGTVEVVTSRGGAQGNVALNPFDPTTVKRWVDGDQLTSLKSSGKVKSPGL